MDKVFVELTEKEYKAKFCTYNYVDNFTSIADMQAERLKKFKEQQIYISQLCKHNGTYDRSIGVNNTGRGLPLDDEGNYIEEVVDNVLE